MTFNRDTNQTVQKIIAEMETGLAVLSWTNSPDETTKYHIQTLKAALLDAKMDLV